MFRIKICGITNVHDARAAADAGADAIGLNFYAKSRRCIHREAARQIAAGIPADVAKVGVFVNPPADEVAELVSHVGLDAVQLHGDEPVALLSQLPTRVMIIRAYRCGRGGLVPLAGYLDDCRALGRTPDALLLDAEAGSEFGGSGQLADWTQIDRQRDVLGDLHLILAGGLTATNVATAIAAVRPHGVDVASGVEREPGRKDKTLVADFVAAARGALTRIQS